MATECPKMVQMSWNLCISDSRIELQKKFEIRTYAVNSKTISKTPSELYKILIILRFIIIFNKIQNEVWTFGNSFSKCIFWSTLRSVFCGPLDFEKYFRYKKNFKAPSGLPFLAPHFETFLWKCIFWGNLRFVFFSPPP